MEFEAAKHKIDEKYGKFERNAEYFAYYSEQVLGNKYTLEKLLEAEPMTSAESLQKILHRY